MILKMATRRNRNPDRAYYMLGYEDASSGKKKRTIAQLKRKFRDTDSDDGASYRAGYQEFVESTGLRTLAQRKKAAKGFGRVSNPAKRKGEPKVSLYSIKSTYGGKHVRKATQVTFPDGQRIRFMERLPKSEAIRAARRHLGRKENPPPRTWTSAKAFRVRRIARREVVEIKR